MRAGTETFPGKILPPPRGNNRLVVRGAGGEGRRRPGAKPVEIDGCTERGLGLRGSAVRSVEEDPRKTAQIDEEKRDGRRSCLRRINRKVGTKGSEASVDGLLCRSRLPMPKADGIGEQ
ncbi:hypothetical protein ERJ75_001771100 [Trypanosoma vivax]|nr:hypothetical protein ERJ75_001771100 [Trypanosoma vivax]